MYIKEIVEDESIENFIEKRLRICFEKAILINEELNARRRIREATRGTSYTYDQQTENEAYSSYKRGLLTELSYEHEITEEQTKSVLEKVSFDYSDFQKVMNKTQNIIWADFEDEILKSVSRENQVFKRLVGYKGEERVLRRMKYLGIIKN